MSGFGNSGPRAVLGCAELGPFPGAGGLDTNIIPILEASGRGSWLDSFLEASEYRIYH